ncbi:hypothetical protein [Marisediminicola antarctica]|uniref:Uncharacterized protein n=1 Tax=Marisediminicola antarctica TaxID=674079 RepID=A0A7L5AKH1_9MICO|nr:hypothetical protein [Marisediminicola antarctica]QHO68799.1 hypothetical protein BHD05_03240 [Marisediminicola antarctica]
MKTRSSTIVWGAILIGFATLFLVGTFVDLSGFSGGVVAAVAIASVGGMLVLGGIIAAVVRSGRTTEPASAHDESA